MADNIILGHTDFYEFHIISETFDTYTYKTQHKEGFVLLLI